MKKTKKYLIKLQTKNSSFFYVKKKSKKMTRTKNVKLTLTKYDPFKRKYEIYKETKLK